MARHGPRADDGDRRGWTDMDRHGGRDDDFTAWKFETDDGAAKAVVALEAAQTDGLVTLVDHAVISWPQGEQRPELHHARDDTKRGTAWGAFWGLLFGGLFFAPLLGVAVGAGVGAVAKSVAGVGIPEEDLESIRSQLTEGTSLLCAVTEGADMDRLGERLRDVVVDVLSCGAPSGIRTALRGRRGCESSVVWVRRGRSGSDWRLFSAHLGARRCVLVGTSLGTSAVISRSRRLVDGSSSFALTVAATERRGGPQRGLGRHAQCVQGCREPGLERLVAPDGLRPREVRPLSSPTAARRPSPL